mgnify:CR=1 FL=1
MSMTVPGTRRHARTAAAACALLVALASCSSDSGTTTSAPTTPASTDGATSTTTAPTTDAATTTADQTTTAAASAPTASADSVAAAMADGCPSEVFPDLSATEGPGGDYAMPSVSVTCADGTMTVTSNDMPSYTYVAMTPNALEEQDFEWTITLDPQVAAEKTDIVNRLGTLGFTTTGIPVYGPTEGAIPPDQAYGDPVHNGLLDGCGGHTGGDADYHYHTIIYTEAACNLQSSELVGYAIDGFPIYNSVVCLDAACTTTDLAQSGYTVTGDPSSEVWNAVEYTGGDGAGTATTNVLDECNGRIEPDGSYAYHLTVTQFPYIIGCFTGTATEQQGAAAAAMPPMNGQAPAGPSPSA